MSLVLVLKVVVATGLTAYGVISIWRSLEKMIKNTHDVSRDTEFSKEMLSPYSRYWIGRYYGPFNGVMAGLLLIGFAVLVYLSEWMPS